MRMSLPLALCLSPLPVLADVPRVVTDIPPVHALVSQVMGDLGTPDLLLDRGANAHSFVLRPSQAAGLQAADLVVWVGPAMTPWLERALDGVANKAHRLELLSTEGTFRRDFGDRSAHDHDDDHDHAPAAAPDKASGHDHAAQKPAADGHDHGHAAEKTAAADHDDDHGDDHDHMHEGTDPHAWLDPANAGVWLDLIAEELAEHDPANAARYAANAEAAKAGVAALDQRVANLLAPVKDRPFVVFHDAYGYFAGHYGLTIAGSLALGDAAAPGAARLQELRAQLVEGNIVCAFPEAQHDPKLIAAMVDGTPVRIGATLDPSGSTLEPGPGLYDALLTGLAENLSGCLVP